MGDVILRNTVTILMIAGIFIGFIGFLALFVGILKKITKADGWKPLFVTGIIGVAIGVICAVFMLVMSAGMAGEVNHNRYNKLDDYIAEADPSMKLETSTATHKPPTVSETATEAETTAPPQ